MKFARAAQYLVTANGAGSPHLNSKVVAVIGRNDDAAALETLLRQANAYDDMRKALDDADSLLWDARHETQDAELRDAIAAQREKIRGLV